LIFEITHAQERRNMGVQYRFPLKQNIGRPSKPVVSMGSLVKRGEMIAVKLEEQLGANLFSSINGMVCDVTEEEIIIEETKTDFTKYEPLTKTTPFELVEESGLVGLGGAGFPTYVKLATKLGREGMIIINAVECEPILTHNIERIENEPEKLLKSVRIIMDILSITKSTIAIKKTHRKAAIKLNEAYQIFQQKKENAVYTIQIKELEDIYPMGEERAIIREVKGVLLSTDAFPSEVDAVVINAETAFRVYDAVENKKPLIDKDITVAGKLAENASIKVLLDVPLGKPVSEVFHMAGGLAKKYGELIMGGPFTGKRTYLTAPVIKTTGGLIATEEFMKGLERIGLLVCACGADEKRLEEIAESMGSTVVGVQYCKQAHEKGNTLKCENPGHCPGQVEKILNLKKDGSEAVLISNCTDCTNTVMSCAPKLKMPVYHCTDGALRAVNYKLIRKMK